MANPKQSLKIVYLFVALLAAVYVVQQFGAATQQGEVRTSTGIEQSELSSSGAIERAFQTKQSNLFVTTEGQIQRILSDDRQEPRHQRIILELPSGHTVLIAHNIDLAPRVANIEVGHTLRVRGDYEWNPQGGVIHWTHHDPEGRREGGWIEHKSRRYE